MCKINRCLNHWLLSMQQRWLKTHVTSVFGHWWVCHTLVGKHFLKYGFIFSWFLVMRRSDLKMSRTLELILESSPVSNKSNYFPRFLKMFFEWEHAVHLSQQQKVSWVGAWGWAICSSFGDHRRNTSVGMGKKDWWDLKQQNEMCVYKSEVIKTKEQWKVA